MAFESPAIMEDDVIFDVFTYVAVKKGVVLLIHPTTR